MSELKLTLNNDLKKDWDYVDKITASIKGDGIEATVFLNRWKLVELYFQIQAILQTSKS